MEEGQGWTLIARVSNNDSINWRPNSRFWKYDMKDAKGKTTDPLDGMDMISPAFWLVGGNEFMITRSDDPHTALLQTTDDCLGQQTFRYKINTSYGEGFPQNQCRSSCNATFGGQYRETGGSAQANGNGCSTVSLLTDNKIGFWCERNHRRSVMMIGAEGDGCSKAYLGIGITKKNEKIKDFRSKADRSPTTDYSLNLWVR